MPLSTGTILAGRYEITAPVAVGGMGEVWRARDRVLDRTVAAKVLRSEYTGDPNFLARFRNEARHTAALTHPNIASVYDYGETRDENDQTVAYLVMEFVEGKTLVSILHEEGRLPVDWTLHVLRQSAEGLSAAHRAGVVHRDIKPGNLIVRPDGVVKLTDFGIAQARDATPLTRTGMVVGTAQYLSPEQAQGMEVTAASDVYSLGVVGYECLAGTRPFDGTSQVAIALAHINRPPPPLPADVPFAVQELIGRALAKQPTERFPDGGAFAEAVAAVQNGGPVPGGLATGGLATGAGIAGATTTELIDTPDDGGTRVLSGAGAVATDGAPAGGPYTRSGPMPPLQGPPATDGPYADYHPHEEPPRRRWPWLVAAVAAVLLLAGGAFYLVSSQGHSGTSGSGRTTSSSAPAALVPIDTNGFIGEDADTVQQQLQSAGLVVTQRVATAAQLQAAGQALSSGAVAGSDPANTSVAKGTQVVLFVAPNGYRPGGGTSTTTTAAPTTTEARTTAAAPTRSTATTTTTAPTTTTTTPKPAPSATTTNSGGGSQVPGPSSTSGGDNGAAGSTSAPGVGP